MKTSLLEIGMNALRADSPFVEYVDGDVVMMDNVRELSEVQPIRADMYIVLLCGSGRLACEMNGQTVSLTEGHVLLAPPRVVLNGYMFSPDFECRILCLSRRIVLGLLRDEVSVWDHAVYVRDLHVVALPDEMRQHFGYYHALIRSRLEQDSGPYRREIMQSVVRAMLYELCGVLRETAEPREVSTPRSQGKVLFSRFLELLQGAQVKRQPVGHYAEMLSVTPKYLTMVCEKHSGKPASAWVDQYVMEDVRYHLCETRLTVKEVSSRLGFANLSHFGTYVRRHTGLSPKAFRESMLK